ncbi:hypothetical protein FOXB_10582 [Fusarium oxysporum f. sp. conglutinans Fo5176]|uniref:Fungal N-terminal domain-containing protein n=1 Tax=Fusarium oxysporum (strain Fo5176) TaxID=660025 RepID=F9FW01_FUSOF|nr:hypothetical protein FOXB_10582 [Fusarium oxysporum f. sp. conglutinans Fo5176]
MADPLSIASGVAGLVSLGLTLCGSLHNYFSNVKGRHQDIETASRSLTLLQSNIFIIQSSTLKLGHRHALSANGVNQGLANCEFELVALQQLMLNLTRDEGLSDIKAKLRKQMTIARYPFDHKKLMQLQDQLSRANAILGNFVQNFNLDINIGISEDLQVLKNYTNANDSITHNMLGTIARRLDAISPAVQRTEVGMATLSQHAQDNSFDTSSHVSDVIVQPHYVQNSQKEQTMMKTLNDPEYKHGNNIAHESMKGDFMLTESTILYDLWDPDYLMELFRLYNFIATLDTSFCGIDICKRKNMVFLGSKKLSDDYLLQVCGKHPEIAEVFGFNDIFRAVMQQDRQKLESIIMGDQLPAGILEKDIYGHNILHASITWPEGLSLLLQHSQTLYPLYDQQSMMIGPLEFAAWSSGKICTQPDKWVLCQNCKCAVSVQLLLEVDCCLPTKLMKQDSLDMCSLRCRRLLFRHYKNRRRRLREISLALSPLEIIHRYGVTVDSIPDATAAFLWDELQSRSDELRRQGFEISSGLKPYYSKYDSCGCFERFQPPEICSLADEFGIRPTDERGIEPLLARVEVLDFSTLGPTFDAETTYLDWLMKHDLKLECMRGGFQTSALHNFGGRIGRILCRFHDVPDRKPPYLWKREAIGLITKICNSDIECNLPCPCVSGVFNRPLASLFSAFATYTPYMDHWSEAIGKACFLVDLIQSIATSVDTSYLAKCAVHINTMELLRVRHVGPCGWIDSSLGITELDEEERVEVLDEDRISLKRLGDLDEEFEQEFQDRNESVVDFLQGYYARRMEEVVREMAEPVGDDYRRGLLAAGVILEEPEESSCDSSLD